mgnify:FL=1
MADILSTIAEEAAKQGISLEGVSFPRAIRLEPGAVREVAGYLRDAGHRSILLVADERTWAAAGRDLLARLESAGLPAACTRVKPNAAGDVVADEASVVQVLFDLQRTGADVCVAVGSGTLHDIVRYAAYTSRIPFVSVPTAASVDGFTSRGAPLILRGEKITVPAIGPDAIFADTDLLVRAPAPMTAAGFGDMLGKITSLFDWHFEHLVSNEPYDPFVADLTRRALQSCLDHADAIGRRDEEGVAILMKALIESGLAMLVLGRSHPASGAEHHLSHYWEMEFIRTGRRQLLHGAKVGVACSVIAGLYARLGEEGLPPVPPESALYPAWQAATGRWEEIRCLIRALPSAEEIREWLRKVQGPATLEALGIEPELLGRALREADRVRPGRTTLLRVYNAAIRE